MSDVDGSFTDPDGRKKLFVSLRPDESSESFAARAVGICFAMSDILPLERVVTSIADNDWEMLPTTRWLEARHRTDPKIRLRVTILPSADGGSIGHLVVEHDDQQVADEWADEQDSGVLLPRADDRRVTKWSSALWRLAHEIRGMADHYEADLARSGLMVESSW